MQGQDDLLLSFNQPLITKAKKQMKVSSLHTYCSINNERNIQQWIYSRSKKRYNTLHWVNLKGFIKSIKAL